MQLRLTNEDRRQYSYTREQLRGDVIGAVTSLGEVTAMITPRFVHAQDRWAERHAPLLGSERVEAYAAALREELRSLAEREPGGFEEVVSTALRLRRQVFGPAVDDAMLADAALPADRSQADIDQSEMLDSLLASHSHALLLLEDARLAGLLREDLGRTLAAGKTVAVACAASEGSPLPPEGLLSRLLPEAEGLPRVYIGEDWAAAEGDAEIAEAVRSGSAFLLVYGETGLTSCRSLSAPAFVRCRPESMTGRALAGQFVREGLCSVYIPAGLDLPSLVPMRRRTVASCRQLAALWRAHGEGVYRLSPQEWYSRWPEVFFSVYEENAEGLPEGVTWPESGPEEGEDWYSAFCRRRDEAISAFLEKTTGVHSLRGWYRLGTLEEEPVPWAAQGEAEGILVHGVLLDRVEGADVLLSAGVPISPRRLLLEETDPPRLQVISNYLFFLTTRLADLYNRLRADRPAEQTTIRGGHMDHMLTYRDGRRVETFPLYRKACMGMREDGSFAFFHFRLRGGECGVNGATARWTAEDVDPAAPGAVAVYTPYASCEDEGASRMEYVRPVGQGRVNLVIVQEELVCARDGDVLLPCMGVVLSLEREAGLAFLREAGFRPTQGGYFIPEGTPELNLRLQEPEGLSAEEWRGMQWVYGGGLTLMEAGRDCFADDEAAAAHLRREGWASPLSAQTQESDVGSLVRHPRTAVGLTEDGRLFVLVYSGRSSISAGADYREMCAIARRLVPGVSEMMNVDGGASAVLGFAVGRRFVEANWPSSSPDSLAGMVRPVNSLFRMRLR